jgi:hypothetical protein
VISVIKVQLPNGFDVTSFAADIDRGVFFVGSRQGAMACYETNTCKLVGVWRRIHSEESVRSIRILRLQSGWTELMTTGRDSSYKIIKITFPDTLCGSLPADIVSGGVDGVHMQVMHCTTLNRGWLEGVRSTC